MKNISRHFFATLLLLCGLLLGSYVQAQVVVQEKPREPVIQKVKSTDEKGRLWIQGHWRWNQQKETYEWVEGHYEKAPRGHLYRKGNWRRVKDGWVWIPGKWVRI